MSNTRNLADLLDTSGDIKSAALDNVTPTTSASDLTSGTLAGARIANNTIDSAHVAAGAVDDAHISGLAATKLTGTVAAARLGSGTASSTTFLRGDNAWAVVDTNLVADTSPQLGGDLDLNSNNITGTGGIPAANLTGTIAAARLDTATTQLESDDSTKIATTAYVVDKITTLIGGAPSTLNDLNELAAAINDDANYNSTLTTALATKLPLAGGAMTGTITGFTSTGIDDNANALAVTIDSSGNVGIGTASPSYKLTLFENANNFLQIQQTGDSVVGSLIGRSSSKNLRIQNSENAATEFWTNNAERMRIDSSGNVGVGTTSPNDKLHVVGNLFLEDSSPEITFETGASHANWQIAAQEWNSQAFQIASGSVDADASNDTFTPRVTVLNSGNVGIGTTTPTGLLHVQGAEPVVKLINTTNSTTVSTSKRIIYNSASGSQGMITDLLFSWQQTTADSWIMVRTPQAYSDGAAGGWADMKLCWSGSHASNNTLKMWTAVFHNNHGQTFSWSKTGITTVGGGSGSYGPYNYTPAVAFYRQTSSAHGYTTNDAWMRNLFIKVSGNSASNVCSQRSLYINGLSGGMEYEVFHMGTTTPGGGLTAV